MIEAAAPPPRIGIICPQYGDPFKRIEEAKITAAQIIAIPIIAHFDLSIMRLLLYLLQPRLLLPRIFNLSYL